MDNEIKITEDGSMIFTTTTENRDILNHIFESVIKKRWKYSKDYTKEKIRYFENKPMPLIKSAKWFNVMNYGYQLGLAQLKHYHGLDKWLSGELLRADASGCYCTYVSVVTYCLLLRANLFRIGELKLTQGFYKHKLRKDFPKFIPMPQIHTGFHAWLNYQGIVFDFTLIPQEGQFFDFKDKVFILGDVPDDLTMGGIDEGHKIIMEYAKEFAGESGLDTDSWIEHHYQRTQLFHKLKG